MITIKLEPFPHEDGVPASWQDNQDKKAIEQSFKTSQNNVNRLMKMFTSILK